MEFVKDAPVASELLSQWLEKRGAKAALAVTLKVSRTLITNWCLGKCCPNRRHAVLIDNASVGAVPFDRWPRSNHTGLSEGAQELRRECELRDYSVSKMACVLDIAQSILCRYIGGQLKPTLAGIDKINKTLELRLTRNDFEVGK